MEHFCLSVQLSRSVVSDSATPWIAARQASLSITNSRSSLRLTSIESVMPSSHLILGRPLLLLPPIPPSIRVFSNERLCDPFIFFLLPSPFLGARSQKLRTLGLTPVNLSRLGVNKSNQPPLQTLPKGPPEDNYRKLVRSKRPNPADRLGLIAARKLELHFR